MNAFINMASRYPRTMLTIVHYVFATLGLLTYGAIGMGLGSMFGHHDAGWYTGLGVYACSYAYFFEYMMSDLDARVDLIRSLA